VADIIPETNVIMLFLYPISCVIIIYKETSRSVTRVLSNIIIVLNPKHREQCNFFF